MRREEMDYYADKGIGTEFITKLYLYSFDAEQGGHKNVAETGNKFHVSKYSDTK